jgi:hypothetical protein
MHSNGNCCQKRYNLIVGVISGAIVINQARQARESLQCTKIDHSVSAFSYAA